MSAHATFPQAPQTAAEPPAAPRLPVLRFVRRAEVVTLRDVPANRTLLEVLREDLGCNGTKEGCGEGDCGACTVVLGELKQGSDDSAPRLEYRAINSCIRLAHSIDGMALWTAEDIAADRPGFVFGHEAAEPASTDCHADCGTSPCPDSCGQASGATGQADAHDSHGCVPTQGTDELHPVQQALIHNHGSQCGFCTPGFVMSLFAMYENARSPDAPHAPHAPNGITPTNRHDAQAALSGNLCRCTGYRPILDAAQSMHGYTPQWVDEPKIASLLQSIAADKTGPSESDGSYLLPESLAELLALRHAHPHAQIIAGATDVGLWITKQHRLFNRILDVTAARELQGVSHIDTPSGPALRIGAAVRLSDAFGHIARIWPELRTFTQRFAGLPVRNSGTLGGNVANGSPIGDSMPLLIALHANVTLASVRGERELPLESLYTGYRQNVMAADEILAWISIPLPQPLQTFQTPQAPQTLLRAYKISKRYDDDISAVCLVVNLVLDGGKIASASIGAGGVAATPVRARQTEAALAGQDWSAATIQQAMQVLRAEFQPISDMRASADYRKAVLGNLLWRLWLESQASARTFAINLESGESASAFAGFSIEGSAA